MKTQRIAIVLTAVNFILLILNLSQSNSVRAQDPLPVLRGRALEIVDDRGQIRASITVEPPVTMNARYYPETVRLRMGDPSREPGVKLTTSVDGSGLGLSDGSQGGVQLSAKRADSFLKVSTRNGREKIIRP